MAQKAANRRQLLCQLRDAIVERIRNGRHSASGQSNLKRYEALLVELRAREFPFAHVHPTRLGKLLKGSELHGLLSAWNMTHGGKLPQFVAALVAGDLGQEWLVENLGMGHEEAALFMGRLEAEGYSLWAPTPKDQRQDLRGLFTQEGDADVGG